MLGALIAIRYKKVELKNYFGVFQEKSINYTIIELKNGEDVLVLIQDLVVPKYSFEANNEPKDLTPDKARSEVKKSILSSKVRHFFEREAKISSNMNRIYTIVWGY